MASKILQKRTSHGGRQLFRRQRFFIQGKLVFHKKPSYIKCIVISILSLRSIWSNSIILFYLFSKLLLWSIALYISRVKYIFHAGDISISIMATKTCFIILHYNFCFSSSFSRTFYYSFRWSSNDVFAMTKIFLVIYWKLSNIFGME